MKLRLLFILLCAAPVFASAQNFICSGHTVNAHDFIEVRESVAKPGNDIDRLRVAENITGVHCLTAEQVAVVCRIFATEQTRMEFAKFAYDHTMDRENYAKVASVFRSESSKRELVEYTKNHQ